MRGQLVVTQTRSSWVMRGQLVVTQTRSSCVMRGSAGGYTNKEYLGHEGVSWWLHKQGVVGS